VAGCQTLGLLQLQGLKVYLTEHLCLNIKFRPSSETQMRMPMSRPEFISFSCSTNRNDQLLITV